MDHKLTLSATAIVELEYGDTVIISFMWTNTFDKKWGSFAQRNIIIDLLTFLFYTMAGFLDLSPIKVVECRARC